MLYSVKDKFLAPGDYIALPGSHVVYVYDSPELRYNPDKQVMEVNTVSTIEANVNITRAGSNVLRGRARYHHWTGRDLRRAGAKNRRWVAR